MEQTVVDERRCIHMPETMDYQNGCAFLATFGTAYYALLTRARLQPGETLLVLGAGGGAGLAAVAMGVRLGAKVIAAASSPDKLALAESQGASERIIYPPGPLSPEQQTDLRDQIKQAGTGSGVDVIYDPIGGDYTEPALRAMRRNGRLLVVGFAAGSIPRIPTNLLLLKGCDIVGVFHGDFWQSDPAEYNRQFAQLLSWFEQGLLKPQISNVCRLEEAPQALLALAERRAQGKLVVDLTVKGEST